MPDVEPRDRGRPHELREISGSGLVTDGDVYMTGQLNAGRDIKGVHYHYHLGAATAAVRVPSQLPPDIGDFTGRASELRTVRRILERPHRRRSTAARVSTIAGKAGVGKTALATHAAHLVRPSFPDGQLYVNLGGLEDRRSEPADVLDRFLRALGVDGTAVPATLEERRDMYRTQVADRRVLVVLDNAAEEAQVQPLLPNSAGSAALITSRIPLANLEGAHPVNLDVLDVDQAVQLLSRVARRRWTEEELEAAHRVVELCGRLPLAVRIAGAKLQARDHWSVEELAERLNDEKNRLDELKIRDLEVRASFALTYEHLNARERCAFRLLSLVKAGDFAPWVAAALFNSGLRQAKDLLDGLVEAQVLEVAGRPRAEGTRTTAATAARYRFHDLLRLFARDCLWKEEPPASQQAAQERALDAYLALAGHAAALLEPGVERPGRGSAWVWTTAAPVADAIAADPAAWFATEWVNLVGAVQEAYDLGIFDLTCHLAGNLSYFSWLRNHWSDWERTQLLALDAGRRAGRPDLQADALRRLGAAYQELEDWGRAADCLHRSLEIAEQLQDDRLIGWALLRLGDLTTEQNDYDKAVEHLLRSMQVFQRSDNRRGLAWARFQLGVIDRYQGRWGLAVGAFQKVLDGFNELGDQSGRAMTLLNLGIIEYERGDLGAAHDHLATCLPIFEELGDRRSVAYTLGHIGYVHHAIGVARGDGRRCGEGLDYLDRGLDMFRQLRLQDGEAWALLYIGIARRNQGQYEEAAACLDQCLDLCAALEDAQLAARARVAQGDLWERQGLLELAVSAYDRAAPVLRAKQDRLWEARLLRGRGLASAQLGHRAAALFAWIWSAARYRSLEAHAEAEVRRLLAELVDASHQLQL